MRPVNGNEPENRTPLGTESGTDRQCETSFDENAILKSVIEKVIQCHNTSRILLRSRDDYTAVFNNFVKVMKLEDTTLKDLKKNLKEYILAYLATKQTWSYWKLVSALKSYCEFGLQIPWPISMKRDVGRLQRHRIKETPRDNIVDEWLRKIPLIDDPYDRLFLEEHFEYGFRAHSHFAKLRWKHIRWEMGEPTAIIAQDEDFKTMSPIIADIPPYLREDIKRWHDATLFKLDEDWIFPWRSLKGPIEHREHSRASIREYWLRFQRPPLNTPKLSPGRCRSWVKSTMRRAGVDWKLREIRQGRDPAEPYDECDLEDDLRDMRRALPNGVLGFHRGSDNQLVDGIPKRWLDLYPRVMNGQVKPSELVDEIFSLQQEMRGHEENRIEP
jgi:hypothetical protein